MQRLSVIGIGKLGLCIAAVLAQRYQVICADINEARIQAVKECKVPNYEQGLDELLIKVRNNLNATTDIVKAVKNSETSFIVVATPSETDGSYSVKYLKSAFESIGKALAEMDTYHVITVVSTVSPGTLRGVAIPTLEKASGKVCGKDFGVCYNPEFIAMGRVIYDLHHPDFILIGESDRKSGDLLEAIYREFFEGKVPVKRMSLENAELAKIALNAFITMKISFANTLAEISERLPTGDVDAITEAIGLETRVGGKYLKGGLAFGGPCFPRDNRAFAYTADGLGCQAWLAKTVDMVNNHQTERLTRILNSMVTPSETVAVLGLTYKPDTDLIDESAPIALIKEIVKKGIRVRVYDPQGLKNAKHLLGDTVEYASSIKNCLLGASLCVVAIPWREFTTLDPEDFKSTMKNARILDCWRLYNREAFAQAGIDYRAIGINAAYPKEH